MTKRQNNEIRRLANFFFEVGGLRKTARMHRQGLLTEENSDNIASHCFRVAVIGLFLAKAERADISKILIMCLLHDIGETRSGDQNWIHKKYVKVFEDEISQDQFSSLPDSKEFLSILNEYKERGTKEAKITKDADLLDQILLLREYEWQGNKEASDWLSGKQGIRRLQTKTAKLLGRAIYKLNPSDWWADVWTGDRRE